MNVKKEQFINGQLRIFEHNPKLKNDAILVLKRLASNADIKSISLSGDCYADYNNLFLNCAKRKGSRFVLNISKLKEKISEDFPFWTEALKASSGFVNENNYNVHEELLSALLFKIPDIDWQEFSAELKRESSASLPMLQNAWKTADYLLHINETIAPAELGAKLFRDSKYLKNNSILTWTCRFLRQKNTLHEEINDKEILEKFGLTANPTASTVMVYGAFIYQFSDHTTMTWIRDLWSKGQSAILSCDNLTDFSELQIDSSVLTIENETVFNKMKQTNPEFAMIYTAGFPGRAVRKFIKMLPTDVQLFHWGDSDPEGYEIAAILHDIHPLKLFRCDTEVLELQKKHCIELSSAKRKRAEKLIQNMDFPFIKEIDWLLQNNLWLEQESYV